MVLTVIDGITATAGGGGTPGGSDTQIQYNDGGVFAGSNLTYNKATGDFAQTGKMVYATGLTSGIWFGDGDTGIYEISDDSLYVKIANLNTMNFRSDRVTFISGVAPGLFNRDGTTTVPNICPSWSDNNTGLGRNGDDTLSLIAGGVEGFRIEEGINGTVGPHCFIPNLTAAPTGNPTAGGYMYVEAGALKYKGSSGTITTLGIA